METSLHQQIKRLVARDDESIEVSLGSYRIDAIDSQNRLVEVQFGPLGALRNKVQALRSDHVVRIIKPIIASKRVVTIDPMTRQVLRSRKSPKQETSIFHLRRVIALHDRFSASEPDNRMLERANQ